MRVLLDENLPHQLRANLPGHDVSTVRYLGWNGLKNGELVRAAESAGFEVFLTSDQNLSYQQNLRDRSIGMVTLTAQKWSVLSMNLEKILAAVDRTKPGSFQVVECGEFRRT
jgi:predicted nuclease of predicted toxin-antitoxin system